MNRTEQFPADSMQWRILPSKVNYSICGFIHNLAGKRRIHLMMGTHSNLGKREYVYEANSKKYNFSNKALRNYYQSLLYCLLGCDLFP